jgi:hypothetical protein
MTEEHKDLNKFLREFYGRTVTGKTKFRLVWSEDITERRRGEFNEFYGKIFLRTVVGVRELPKYNYIHNRYILEGWSDVNLSHNGEVPEASNGDYVPIWVFEDSKGNPLPVTRKVLNFLIASIQGRVKKDYEVSEEVLNDLQIAKTIESFDNHPADFSTSGPTRNAVAYTKGLKNVTRIDSN